VFGAAARSRVGRYGRRRRRPSCGPIRNRTDQRPQPAPHRSFRHFLPITTRWIDNDVYGHVNNVVYYSYFDTVVNEYLVRNGVLDIEHSDVIGLVVETHCNFFSPVAFPATLQAGLRVGRLGTSSVRA
jgi:acyl-CoA thioester hydrolase